MLKRVFAQPFLISGMPCPATFMPFSRLPHHFGFFPACNPDDAFIVVVF